MVYGEEPLDNLIKQILIFQKTAASNCIFFNSLAGFCNYDGDYLFIVNSPLKLEELKALKVE